MNLTDYIAGLRSRAATIEKQIASISEKGSRTWSRWGYEPLVETTGSWLNELKRRHRELLDIANALEQGQRA